MAFKKRITVRLKRPNPLFEEWLTEWRDKAIEMNSNVQHTFDLALESLRKYPLPLESGRDCKILYGFGDKLCKMVDKRLAEYKAENKNYDENTTESKIRKNKVLAANTNLNRSLNSKEYIPHIGSGAYVILVVLYKKSLEPEYPGYLFKHEIIKYGQCLCDKSFVKPDAGSYYTAWSSMKTLLDKQLVVKRSSPAKISLTAKGVSLAHKLYEDNLNSFSYNCGYKQQKKSPNKAQESSTTIHFQDVEILTNKVTEIIDVDTPSSSLEPSSSQIYQDNTFIFAPNSFDIILIVDKQERCGKDKFDDPIINHFKFTGITFEVKHLKVGDYTWICRERTSRKELVLPYIIERKRMDDFGSSIKDGRFHDQKFRLKQSGIQNLIYLVESYGNNTHTGLPITTLYQAATNTLIQDGFCVKFTNDIKGTVEYLAVFTTILKQKYSDKTLVSCPKENLQKSSIQDDLISLMTFDEFNKSASKMKNFKIQDLFISQLLQLKGMSVDKALAIVKKYPTPYLLHSAYKSNSGSNGEKLLSSLQYGTLNKKIGPAISRSVYLLFTKIAV